MSLPSFLDGIRIEKCENVDQPPFLGPKHDAELRMRCQYRITSCGSQHHLVAADSVWIHEDNSRHFENSPLLPDVNFSKMFCND